MPVAAEFNTLPDVKRILQDRAPLQEQIIPIREFRYREDGDRNVTLEKDGVKFVVDDPHAKKQLCGLIKYPAKVFDENDPDLNMTIMRERLPSTRSPQHLLKWYQDGEIRHLRAVLPHPYITIRDQEMVDIALQTMTDRPYRVHKLTTEGPVTSMRIVAEGDVVDIGGKAVTLGLNLVSSEVGASRLIVDTLLYVPICTNGAIVTWGSDRYFSHSYREIQANDLRDIFTNAMARFRQEQTRIRDLMLQAVERRMSQEQVLEQWKVLRTHRAASKKFIEEISGEFEMAAQAEPKTYWDLVNHITQKAHETLPSDQRIRHELFAGQLLGLDLDPSGANLN